MILLDTQVIVWLLAEPERLSSKAREAILRARQSGEEIVYSPVSLYEIVFAVRRGRLPLRTSAEEFISAIEIALYVAPLTPQ